MFIKKNIFVANAFISPFNTQTMHTKSFCTQQHCNVFPKNLIPWQDSNPGLLVPEADAMSTAPRRLRCSSYLLLALAKRQFAIYNYLMRLFPRFHLQHCKTVSNLRFFPFGLRSLTVLSSTPCGIFICNMILLDVMPSSHLFSDPCAPNHDPWLDSFSVNHDG
jgi:hypothetical protein